MPNSQRGFAFTSDDPVALILESLQGDVAGFRKLAAHLKRATGINLEENGKNLSLMAGRLNKVLRVRGLSSYAEYLECLESGDPRCWEEFICAMTTNTTQFFREEEHFDALKRVLSEVLRRRQGQELRIWCAAASTGQEPYSIAMALEEARAQLPVFSHKFLATDIDQTVLKRAMNGVYTEEEVASVPPLYRQKYFRVGEGSRGQPKEYQVSHALRESIRFATFNLMESTFPFQHPFDIIFCRNVLIYFDRATCEGVLARLQGALGKGGHLFLGHSETGMMKIRGMSSVCGAVYRRDE